MEKRVTIETLAQKLGLGISTVGFALQGTGTVSEKTRKRVLEAAAQLGYKPNLHASALARRRSIQENISDCQSVAVLHSDEVTITDRITPELKIYARSLGMELHIFNLREYDNLPYLGRLLHARGFTGIMIERVMDEVNFTGFPWEHFSIVAVGRHIYEWPVDIVRISVATTLRHALLEVTKRGYQRPGVCLCMHNEVVADDWDRVGEALAYNVFNKSHKAVTPFLDNFPAQQDILGYERKICRWFKQHKPDVVVGMHINIFYVLRSNGWCIPGDTSYLSLLMNPMDTWQAPITGFVAGEWRAPYIAVDRLSFLLKHNRQGLPDSACEIVFKPLWNEGNTLPWVH